MGIEAAFVAVGSFITAGAATGAVAAVVGGVVIGAVAGGVIAAVTGGDIIKGALIGGALGGLAGWASTLPALGGVSGAPTSGMAGGAAEMAAADASWAGISADIAGTSTMSGLEAGTGTAAGLISNPGAPVPAAKEGFFASLTAKDAIAPGFTLIGDTLKGVGEGMAAEEQAKAQSEADELAYQRSLRTTDGLSDMPWAPTEIRKTMTERLEDMTGVLNLNATGLLQPAAAPVVATAPQGAQVANPMGAAVAPQAASVRPVPQPLLN